MTGAARQQQTQVTSKRSDTQLKGTQLRNNLNTDALTTKTIIKKEDIPVLFTVTVASEWTK